MSNCSIFYDDSGTPLIKQSATFKYNLHDAPQKKGVLVFQKRHLVFPVPIRKVLKFYFSKLGVIFKNPKLC